MKFRGTAGPSTSRRPCVFIAGAGIPPPIGGVTVHVERLGLLLSERGYRVEIFDTTGIRHEAKVRDRAIRVWQGPVAYVAFLLVLRLVLVRPAVLHWHVGAFWRASKHVRLMAGLSCLAPTILTIHSGSFAARLASSPASFRKLLVRLCNRCVAVVGVNDSIANAIRDLGAGPRAGIHTIPAFLQAPPAGGSPRSARVDRNVKAIASGYGTSIYGWHTLVPALADPRIDEWHWAIYTGWDADYMSAVLKAAERTAPGKLTLHRELRPADFQRLLASCDVFVRPTETDGDSLALREAIASGLSVVASDAAPRPEGCAIFRTGDAEHLIARLAAFGDAGQHRLPAESGSPLADLYQSVARVAPPDAFRWTQPETGA
jgi:glycogen(starch) synthase